MTVKFYNGMEITATMTMLNEISADYVEKELMMAMKKKEYRKKVMKYMMHCITLDFMMNYNKKG